MNHALSIIGKTAILTIPDAEVDEVVVNGKVFRAERRRINLNEKIKVKLSDYGRKIYYKHFDELGKWFGLKATIHAPKCDEDGYTTFQLWEFMNLYGEHFVMAGEMVIDPLEIIVKGK